MTQVSRKGFVDKNGQKVVIVPPKEEYAGEDIFQNSDAIDTILSEGVHHISYKKDGKKYPTQHILVVTRDYGKTGPIAPTREIGYQFLIDNLGGMMKRYRKFTDTELLEPDGDWTEWVSMIPTIDIDSSITEDGDNPVTGAAIYAALAARTPYYDGEVIIKHLDDPVPYPFDGDNEVKNKVEALYNAIPKSTYVLCRVTLDNRDYSGSEDEIVTVPAFAYATEEQEDTWNVDVIFANGVKFSTGRQGTYAQSWTKTTNSFFS